MTATDEVRFSSWDGLELSGTFQPAINFQVPIGHALLVHGITADRSEWGFYDRLAIELAAWGISSLRFDYRCHGTADFLPMTELSLGGISKDIEAAAQWLMTNHGARRLVVCGVSFGGGIATEWAVRHRSVVRKLVLCSPVLDYVADLTSCAPGWRADLAVSSNVRYGSNSLSRAIVNEMPAWDRLVQGGPWPSTVVFHGDHDSDVPIERSRHAVEGQDATLVTVSGADHGFVVPGDIDAKTPETLANYDFVFNALRDPVCTALREGA